MNKTSNKPTDQNRRKTAFLALVIICLKSLLPLLTASLFSQTVAASPALVQISSPLFPSPETEAFQDNTSIEAALQFICTPSGIKPLAAATDTGTRHSDSSPLHNHCDNCIAAGYLGLKTAALLLAPRWNKPQAVTWKNGTPPFSQSVTNFLSAPRAPPLG
ncbi:hypothetical protein O4H49_13655 [Kiloniella laminariae]|uniref:DUF2946 domain-containing protein n=2 Tax=Kiloniella laminariae TaxID=454162 RepID=A0ABT4LL47_9PROT|nr:hypothetical protein [Kiloniella laminariae]